MNTATGANRFQLPTKVAAVLRFFVRLFKRQQHALWVWGEILVLSVGGYSIATWWNPLNPLFVGLDFPWTWLAPMILALRYGVIAGTVSLALLWGLHWAWWLPIAPTADAEMPGHAFFGGFVFTFLCGQFCEVWSFRVHRALENGSFLEERLAALTRDHYLLRLSHDRVLQDMLIKPVTLRDSLAKIRGETMRAEVMSIPSAPEFLRLVGHLCALETAALYAMSRGEPEPAAIATLGEPQPLERADPLVGRALESKELAHVRLPAAGPTSSRYLVCAPALDSDGNNRFLLTVELMPFTALTMEGLQTLSVLLGYYADSLSMARVIRRVREAVPHVESGFALELMRLTRIAHETGLESGLAALTLEPGPDARAIWDQLLRSRRSVDSTWPIVTANRYALLTIMPLSGAAAIESYLLRIERLLRERFGFDFEASIVTPHTTMIDGESPAELLAAFLKRCRV